MTLPLKGVGHTCLQPVHLFTPPSFPSGAGVCLRSEQEIESGAFPLDPSVARNGRKHLEEVRTYAVDMIFLSFTYAYHHLSLLLSSSTRVGPFFFNPPGGVLNNKPWSQVRCRPFSPPLYMCIHIPSFLSRRGLIHIIPTAVIGPSWLFPWSARDDLGLLPPTGHRPERT